MVDPKEEERALVGAAREGDADAFGQLVSRYQRDVYRLCFRYLHNHEDANDVAQDVFLRAYRALPKFRGDSAFSTWLYRIAVNACLNVRSARKPPAEELPDSLADGLPAVSEKVEREDEARRVREAVGRLPAKQRATVILKVYQDLTHQEVARILGTSVGTVKANLFHALGNLRKALGAGAAPLNVGE